MTITSAELQTLGLSLLERIRKTRENIAIMEAGVVIARLVPESASSKPWHELAGQAVLLDDLTKPVLGEGEVEDSVRREAGNLQESL